MSRLRLLVLVALAGCSISQSQARGVRNYAAAQIGGGFGVMVGPLIGGEGMRPASTGVGLGLIFSAAALAFWSVVAEPGTPTTTLTSHCAE